MGVALTTLAMVPSSVVAWSDHQSYVLKGFKSFLETGVYSDLEIKCNERSFHVHKLILALFTDYFNDYDGLWVRLDINIDHMENILRFIYTGQVVVAYDQMEGFLRACKILGLTLFKDKEMEAAERMAEEAAGYQERYELNDFQLMCRECYKCFPDDKALKKHTWSCQRVPTFKCSFCDKMFRHRNDVNNHERLHTGERPFVCPRPGCTKDFKLRSAMNTHVKIVHDKVTWPCPECDMVFKAPMGRRYHMGAVHAKEKPFPCKQCGKCFAQRDILSAHMGAYHATKAVKRKRYAKMMERKRAKKAEEAANASTG